MKNEYLDNLFIHTSQNWLLYLMNKGLPFLRVDFDFPIKIRFLLILFFFIIMESSMKEKIISLYIKFVFLTDKDNKKNYIFYLFL